jgi:hypothetical protein
MSPPRPDKPARIVGLPARRAAGEFFARFIARKHPSDNGDSGSSSCSTISTVSSGSFTPEMSVIQNAMSSVVEVVKIRRAAAAAGFGAQRAR